MKNTFNEHSKKCSKIISSIKTILKINIGILTTMNIPIKFKNEYKMPMNFKNVLYILNTFITLLKNNIFLMEKLADLLINNSTKPSINILLKEYPLILLPIKNNPILIKQYIHYLKKSIYLGKNRWKNSLYFSLNNEDNKYIPLVNRLKNQRYKFHYLMKNIKNLQKLKNYSIIYI